MNHASIVVIIDGVPFVAESESKGFILNPLEDSVKGRKIFVKRFNGRTDEAAIIRMVLLMLGRHRYDYFSLLFFQVYYSLTGKWIGKRDEHASKRLYCSEAIAYIFNKLTGLMVKWWMYNPQMLYDQPGFDLYELE